MFAFHAWFVPLVGLVFLWLMRKKFYRDAALFLFLSLAGYGLWFGVTSHRPFIITVFIADIIEAFKTLWA